MVVSAYEVVTNRILELLKKGVVPWRVPWGVGDRFAPRNAVSKRPYSGINSLLLNSLDWEDNRFLTFRQARELGGRIRKGSRGCPVVSWHVPEDSEKTTEEKDRSSEPRPMFLRYYTVFNVQQTEGIKFEDLPVEEWEEQSDAASIVQGMPSPPQIIHGKTRALYRVQDDQVELPDRYRFESSDQYYSTLFHELAHSTGHASRLDRKTVNGSSVFDRQAYAKEELIAEIASTYLCSRCGLQGKVINASAAYIDHWYKTIKNDTRIIVQASAAARKAADYIADPNHH